MRLVNVDTLRLEEFDEQNVPPYTALSHRWQGDEVTFDHIQSSSHEHKMTQGYRKIADTCAMTARLGLKYTWIDTCCINKDSSAELTEAINSMFAWYNKAKICLVYLFDIDGDRNRIGQSVWFSRAWTLQELLAPVSVQFYDRRWQLIGSKRSMAEELSFITRIDVAVLRGQKSLAECSVAQRMSWAARRAATRSEDRAYSLLGLFGVTMTQRYGEGSKAFARLQKVIIAEYDDDSIFAWDRHSTTSLQHCSGLIAEDLASFESCASVVRMPITSGDSPGFTHSNRGTTISLTTLPYAMNEFLAVLNCGDRNEPGTRKAVLLQQLHEDSRYCRVLGRHGSLFVVRESQYRDGSTAQKRTMCVRQSDPPPYGKDKIAYAIWVRMFQLPQATVFEQKSMRSFAVDGNTGVGSSGGRLFVMPNGTGGTVGGLWASSPSHGYQRWSKSNCLRWMKVGFTADFLPCCMIGNHSARGRMVDPPSMSGASEALSKFSSKSRSLFDAAWLYDGKGQTLTEEEFFNHGYFKVQGSKDQDVRYTCWYLDLRVQISLKNVFDMPRSLQNSITPSQFIWTIDLKPKDPRPSFVRYFGDADRLLLGSARKPASKDDEAYMNAKIETAIRGVNPQKWENKRRQYFKSLKEAEKREMLTGLFSNENVELFTEMVGKYGR